MTKNNSKDWVDLEEPRLLSKVIGQESTKIDLIKRLQTNTLSQNILLSGPTGTGKTTIIKIILKTLNCENPSTDTYKGKEFPAPCNECNNCLSINNKESYNNFNYYNGSELNKDRITNEIQKICNNPPMFGNNRVIYIEEIQEISSDTAFLELLADKYDNRVFFVMATMNVKKLDKAVVDRFSASHYKLKALNTKELFDLSFSILNNRGYIVEDSQEKTFEKVPESFFTEGIASIIEMSEGSARNFVGNLEKCIYRELWTKEQILKEFEFITNEDIYSIILRLIRGDKDFFIDINKLSNKQLEEFFDRAYRLLTDFLIYGITNLTRFDWQENQFKALKQFNKNIKDLIKIFDYVYERSSSYYLKKSYLLSKFYDYFISLNISSDSSTINTSKVQTPLVDTSNVSTVERRRASK